jgi:hypothetical protein
MLLIGGDFAYSFFVCVIAVHTYRSLVLRSPTPAWVSAAVVVFGWTSASAFGRLCVRVVILQADLFLMLATVPAFVKADPKLGSYYGESAFICAVTRTHPIAEFVLYLFPVGIRLLHV